MRPSPSVRPMLFSEDENRGFCGWEVLKKYINNATMSDDDLVAFYGPRGPCF